jgi:hypothetical protein
MANKRTLKHAINLICEELFNETIAASLYGNDQHKGNADALLFSIVKMQANYISRVSHPEPGMAPKKYYKDLREKFSAEASDIADHINQL